MKLSIAAKSRRLVGLAIRARGVLGRNGSNRRRIAQQRSEFYRSVWREAANELGATIEQIAPDVFRIERSSLATHVYRNYTDLDGPVTLRIAGNKPITQTLLSATQLPVVESLEFSAADISNAKVFLKKHKRCVVKPSSGTGAGQGITTNVTTVSRLRYATSIAAGFANSLTIERQIAGDNIRLLFLDGKLLDAVRRGPPHVVGDGVSSIRKLVRQQNQERIEGGFEIAQTLLACDLDMQWTLAETGQSLRSIPQEGMHVQLKTVINDNKKSENEDVTHIMDESIVNAARRAAAAIHGRAVGVDVIVPDATEPIEHGVIIEVNTTPGFYYHYYRSSTANRVAIPILERCLESSRQNQDRTDSKFNTRAT